MQHSPDLDLQYLPIIVSQKFKIKIQPTVLGEELGSGMLVLSWLLSWYQYGSSVRQAVVKSISTWKKLTNFLFVVHKTIFNFINYIVEHIKLYSALNCGHKQEVQFMYDMLYKLKIF